MQKNLSIAVLNLEVIVLLVNEYLMLRHKYFSVNNHCAFHYHYGTTFSSCRWYPRTLWMYIVLCCVVIYCTLLYCFYDYNNKTTWVYTTCHENTENLSFVFAQNPDHAINSAMSCSNVYLS